MILAEGSDLFKLIGRESVSKRNLYDLVQYLKFSLPLIGVVRNF